MRTKLQIRKKKYKFHYVNKPRTKNTNEPAIRSRKENIYELLEWFERSIYITRIGHEELICEYLGHTQIIFMASQYSIQVVICLPQLHSTTTITIP
jgi:hypothetical protein